MFPPDTNHKQPGLVHECMAHFCDSVCVCSFTSAQIILSFLGDLITFKPISNPPNAPPTDRPLKKKRYPNGNPAKPRDGYTTEGTGIAQKGTPTFTALPTNVNVCCDGDDAVEPAAEKDGTLCSNGNRLVGGGSMEPFGTTFNFTVSCSSIPPVMINGCVHKQHAIGPSQ